MSETTPNLALAYESHLLEGRDEARRWRELLSNRDLAEDIAQTKRELAEVQVGDLNEAMERTTSRHLVLPVVIARCRRPSAF